MAGLGGGWRMALMSTHERGGVGWGGVPGWLRHWVSRWGGAREILCYNCPVDLLSGRLRLHMQTPDLMGGLQGPSQDVRLSLSYQPLPPAAGCTHCCSSILQQGDLGEDARKRRCPKLASLRALGFDSPEASFEWMRLQIFPGKNYCILGLRSRILEFV